MKKVKKKPHIIKKKKRRGSYDAGRFELEDLLELDEEEEFLRDDADEVEDDPEEEEPPIEDLAESLDSDIYDRQGDETSLSEEPQPVPEAADDEEVLTDDQVLEYTQEWERIPDDILDLEGRAKEPEEYDAYDDGYDGYSDDEDDEDDGEEETAPAGPGVRPDRKNAAYGYNTGKKKSSLSGLEIAAIAMSVVLAVTAISLICAFLQLRDKSDRLAGFKTIGSDLKDVSIIGAEGLGAVRLACAERQELWGIDAFPEEEPQETEEEPEEDTGETVIVAMSLSSIKSDLKIKFSNDKTGKLIANVPFEVSVKNPEGEERTWEDDDRDGMIYRTDIVSGKWTVSMKPLEEKYKDRYEIDTKEQDIKVRDTIEYKRVDVTGEIKKESQVDVAKEDTEPQEATSVESENVDTVEWVESSKEEIGEEDGKYEFIEINKKQIKKPTGVLGAMRERFSSTVSRSVAGAGSAADTSTDVRISSEGVSVAGETEATGETGTGATAADEAAQAGTTAADEATTASDTGSTDTASEGTTDAADAATTQAASDTATTKDAADTASTAAADGGATTAGSGATDASDTGGSKASDAASTSAGNGGTGKTSGDAGSTDSSSGGTASTKDETPEIKVSPENVTMIIGDTAELEINIKNIPKDRIAAFSSDDEIATISDEGVIKALKNGKAIIKVYYIDDDEVWASCKVIVGGGAQLFTEDNEKVYVKEDDGTYREASEDDYNSESKFYVKKAAKKYIYHGWQDIDGHTYYFDKNGTPVTGDQTILGVKYHFGSDGVLAKGSGELGIDVSTWNGSVDWNAVKNSGISFAIIRCGFRGTATGVLVEDSRFHTNMKGALNAGLKVGVYFYSSAVNDVEAVEEASMAATLCSGYKLSYPVFLDVERSSSGGGRADGLSPSDRTAVIRAFCATMENSGYKAGLYANKNWMEDMIDTPSLSNYRLWLAQYAAAPTYSRTRFDIWQYTSKGSIGGISGRVDLNISYLNY